MAYKTLLVEESGGVLLVTLNRPEVHNAFNDELITEAIDLFRDVGQRDVTVLPLEAGDDHGAGTRTITVIGGRSSIERLEAQHFVDEEGHLDAVTLHDERANLLAGPGPGHSKQGADVHHGHDVAPKIGHTQEVGGSEGHDRVFVEHDHLARVSHLDGKAISRERDHARASLGNGGLRRCGKRRHRWGADRAVT